MAKKVLQINKFSGGLNSYSDPRDLKEGEFQVLDNAAVDEEGVIRVSGGLEVKDNIDINQFNGEEVLLKSGKGLFSYATDYYESIYGFNSNLESGSSDNSSAWGVVHNDGGTGGTWKFEAEETNTNGNGPGYFNLDSMAINYMGYTAPASENHGSLSYNGIKLSPGKSYSVLFDVISENPWYFLGSNIPPRIRLYNSILGQYLYPDGFSTTSDATHTALISTDNGNLIDAASVGGSPYWNSPGGETLTRQAVDASNPTSSSSSHETYNSHFGGTDADAGYAGGNAFYLKIASSAAGNPFTSGNFSDSDNITVVANTTYLIDCIYNTNGATGTTAGVGMRILNKDDGDAVIPFNNGSNTAPPSSQWVHFNSPVGENPYATPTSLEFTTPNLCTSIAIRVGVDNDGTGADYAGFSGFNLRKKMYELYYLDELSTNEGTNTAFYKHPNSWNNTTGGTGTIWNNDSPYMPDFGPIIYNSGPYNEQFQKARKYKLNFTIPIHFDESNDWVFSLEAGIWGGINQGDVNNFVVGSVSFIENDESFTIGKDLQQGHNIITQHKNLSDDSMNMDLYNHNPITKEYNKLTNLSLPNNSNSIYNFTRGSKDVYICDETFNDGNLYVLKNNKLVNNLQINSVNFSGPSITYSGQGTNMVGVDVYRDFDAHNYYSSGGNNTHAGNTATDNNNLVLSASSSIFHNSNSVTGNAENTTDFVLDRFNQFSGNMAELVHDVATGTGSGLPTGISGFKYDMDDSDWLDSTNPYTKYIVIKNDDIVGTTNTIPGSLDTGKRIAQVYISMYHNIWTGHVDYTDFANHYSANMKVYLDVIEAAGSDITAHPPDVDGSEGGYAIPGDARFIATIGEVELNPSNKKLANYTSTDHTDWVGAESLGWKISDWGDASNNKHVKRQFSHYSESFTGNIYIPYTATAGGSNITVHASSGTNLQLRFVPQISPQHDFWHKGPAYTDTWTGDNGQTYTRYFADGILSDRWNISSCNIFAYKNNTANTEDSFALLSQDLSLNVEFQNPSEGEADGWDSDWTFYLTSVDDNDIESSLGDKSSIMVNTDVTKSPKIDILMSLSNDLYHTSSYKFIKGYASSNRNSNYNLQFIIDLKKQTIKSSTSENEFNHSIFQNFIHYQIPSEEMLIPNEIDTYESETGILSSDALDNGKSMTAIFKTAVIANSTLYAGNVYQNGVHYPDRMLKSPIGKVPLLPSSNFIDVAINDGDEIVSLQFYKDTLLQFKKSRLYIISTSEDYEYLQDTVENVGITQESQITMTAYGVAWINSRGCYLYDGKKVNYLIDLKIAYKEWKDSESSWEIDEKYGPSIHYLKKEDKLIIYGATDSLKNIEENEGSYEGYSSGFSSLATQQAGSYIKKQFLRKMGYQFDFKTKSWSMITSFPEHDDDIFDSTLDGRLRVPVANNMVTNFSYDENGDSIFMIKPDNRIFKWDDNPKQTIGYLDLDILGASSNEVHRDFKIITKDYDFGAPSVRKKIYKVYVTFKSTHIESNKDRKLMQNQDLYSSSNVGVYYAINGTNTWTEFSETKSSNYGAKGLVSDDSETTTTLSSDVNYNATSISVVSATNIKVGYVLRINEEQMLVTSVSGTTIGVQRAYNATTFGGGWSQNNHTRWLQSSHKSSDKVNISTGDWIVSELKPDSSINNIDSCKLKFETKKVSGASNDDNGVPSGFMINDISVIYRIKNVR